MTLLALLVVAVLGGTLAGLLPALAAAGRARPSRAAAQRAGTAVGVAALIGVLAATLLLGADAVDPASFASREDPGLFGGSLVPNPFLRLALALWALDGLLIAGLVAVVGGSPRVLPATLLAIGAAAASMAAADITMAAASATVAGLAGLVAVLAAPGDAGVVAAARELRAVAGGGAAILAGVAVAPIAAAALLEGRAAGGVVGLAALALVLGYAVRSGAVPFHLRVPRLSDVAPPLGLPLLLAWAPLPLGVAALAGLDALVAPLGLRLDGERWIFLGLAVLTLGAATLAAVLQDDLRHAAGYLVIADVGLVLAGLAALDPAGWGPTRTWLVLLATSKTALLAWAAVVEHRYGTRSLPELRGWARRSPLLAAAFGLTALATFGLPGLLAWTTRLDLARAAVVDPGAVDASTALVIGAASLVLAPYVRLARIGVMRPSSRVSGAPSERILRGAPAGGDADHAADGSPVVVAESADATAGPAALPPSGRPSSAAGALRDAGAAISRNRAPLASALVLALGALAALTALGAGGLADAAAQPPPGLEGPSSD